MSANSKTASKQIYQIKVTLRGSKPPIWRRLLVSEAVSLFTLHEIIQIAMGWTDSHMHQFIIAGEYYSTPSPDDLEPVIDERRHRLGHVAPAEKDKFIYEYDFGDSWEHDVVVEKIIPPEQGAKYPVCITGKRACPPEDVGGVWGYETFLAAMKDPDHEEHESYKEWWGMEFHPEALDLDDINEALQDVK